jgi:hypothetical protein
MPDHSQLYQDFLHSSFMAPQLSMMNIQQLANETMLQGSGPGNSAMQQGLSSATQPTGITRMSNDVVRRCFAEMNADEQLLRRQDGSGASPRNLERRQDGSGASPMNTLFVSDLRRGTTSDVLGMHFAQFGVITRSEVLRDGTAGHSRGCGRVEFQGAIPDRVFAMEHRIEGRPCRVQRAVLLPRHPPRKKNSKPRTNPPSQSSQGAGPATATEPPVAKVQAVPPRTPTALAAIAAAAVADLDQEQRRFQVQFSDRLSSLAGKRKVVAPQAIHKS